MRHYTILSAIALVAFLTLAGPSTARQLGPDAQPNLYTGKQLIDDGSCATSLAKHLWGVSASGKLSAFDPTKDTFPKSAPQKSGVGLQHAIVVDCDKKATEPHADRPFLIHGSLWRARGPSGKPTFALVNSEWEVYAPLHAAEKGSQEGEHVLLEHGYHVAANGQTSANILETTPALYGAKEIQFLGMSCFLDFEGKPLDASQIKDFGIQYKIGTTAVPSDATTDFEALVSAVLGKVPAATGGQLHVMNLEAMLEFNERPTQSPLPCRATYALVDSKKLPVNLGITMYAGGQDQGDASATGNPPAEEPEENTGGPREADTPSASAGSPVAPAAKLKTNAAATDCTAASVAHGCSLTHPDIPVKKPEAFGFGLGIPIPGVLEPQYSSANPANLGQPVRHTSLYGFVNIFPFARWAAKSSLAPSLVAGIPVTGQIFYRPFFGIGESLNGFTALNKILPMQINFLAGVMWLNQEVVDGNGAGGLQIGHARTLKKMFGIEVPVGALVSKITSIGGKGGSSSSGN